MTSTLDLTLRAFAIRRGEITGVGTWIIVEGQWVPGMALLRTGDERNEHSRPFFITMDNAWIWDEKVGDPQAAARQLFIIAQNLRLEVENPRTLTKIFSFINDHLGDLLSMSRMPPRRDPKPVLAEVTITNTSTGKTREVEVRDV